MDLNSTLDRRLLEVCRQWQAKAAVVYEGESCSYARLGGGGGRAAAALAPRPSAHVGLLGQNHPAYIAGFFGALYAGRTLVPMNPQQAPEELARIVEHSEQRVLLHTHKTAPLAAAVADLVSHRSHSSYPLTLLNLEDLPQTAAAEPPPPATTPDDLAMILYTSGTTGDPKGVMLTHANFLANEHQYAASYEFTPDDHFYLVLPMFHIFAVTTELLSGFFTGATLLVHESFNPKLLLKQFTEYSSGVYIAVPPMYAVLARYAQEGTPQAQRLRVCVSGGGPMPPEIQRAFESRVGCCICEGYGLTEASPVLTSNVPRDNRKGTVGRGFEGTQLSVRDEAGQPLPPGSEGELWARGPNVMKGYYKNPAATADAITGDGWLRTGDLARIDADGYVAIVGRKKDVIVCAGENIYPREIEDVLVEHPSVLEVAVIGVPDRLKTEVPKAFLVPASEGAELDFRVLTEWCRARLGHYKIPVHWEAVAQLPKTATGKVQKVLLRQQELERQQAQA